jgi:hypothetical protein
VAGQLGTISNVDDGVLATCFSNMRAVGLQLSLEIGAIDPLCGGCTPESRFYNEVAPIIGRLINLGAPLTLLQLQEPYTNARYAGGGTCDFNCAQSLADQNARYIQLIRNAGWGVQILLEEAFPYNPVELLTFWDFQLMNHCASYGTQRPEYFEIDHDWRYQGGPWSWDDVGLLRDVIHGRNAQFGVIFWGAEDDNSHNDADWANDVNYQGFTLSRCPQYRSRRLLD